MGIINEENKDNGSQIKNYSSMTIIAMILGICGLVLSCACIGMLPAMAGAVLSIITLVKGTKKKGIALIALVSSVLGIVIAVVVGIIAMFASDDTVNNGKTDNSDDNPKSEPNTVGDNDAVTSEIGSAADKSDGKKEGGATVIPIAVAAGAVVLAGAAAAIVLVKRRR